MPETPVPEDCLPRAMVLSRGRPSKPAPRDPMPSKPVPRDPASRGPAWPQPLPRDPVKRTNAAEAVEVAVPADESRSSGLPQPHSWSLSSSQASV